jgi:hypothetical protein
MPPGSTSTTTKYGLTEVSRRKCALSSRFSSGVQRSPLRGFHEQVHEPAHLEDFVDQEPAFARRRLSQ